MTLELGLTLLALALVDSLSAGTLLIPVVFLIAPRLRPGRLLVYLGTIAAFYFAVGLALLAGASALIGEAGALLASPPARAGQLVLGVALLVGSFFLGGGTTTGSTADGAGKAGASDVGPGRLARWRDRAMAEGGGGGTLILLALGAGVVEVATMLPYLGAIGFLTSAGVPLAAATPILALYCAVMVLPALLLLAVRVMARRLVEPPLARLASWLQRTSRETTAWVVGIVGFLLARDAATTLGLFGTG